MTETLSGAGPPSRTPAVRRGLTSLPARVAEETIVRAVESEAFERALRRVLSGPVVEGAVEDALTSPAVERALLNALDSEMIDHVWERLLASDEAQKLVERIAEAPEVRAAVAAQGVGLIEDLGRSIRGVTRRADQLVETAFRRIFSRPRRKSPTNRAGLITRGLALVVDGVILNLAFLAVSALVALIALAVFGQGDGAEAPTLVIGTTAWLVFGGLYLVWFWALAGQTPGMRFLALRLNAEGERRLGLRRAVRRLFGLALAVLPLGLGLVSVLSSDRRTGLHDRIARTEVLYVETSPRPAPWSGAPLSPQP